MRRAVVLVIGIHPKQASSPRESLADLTGGLSFDDDVPLLGVSAQPNRDIPAAKRQDALETVFGLLKLTNVTPPGLAELDDNVVDQLAIASRRGHGNGDRILKHRYSFLTTWVNGTDNHIASRRGDQDSVSNF